MEGKVVLWTPSWVDVPGNTPGEEPKMAVLFWGKSIYY
jgi:hypothetical protein